MTKCMVSGRDRKQRPGSVEFRIALAFEHGLAALRQLDQNGGRVKT